MDGDGEDKNPRPNSLPTELSIKYMHFVRLSHIHHTAIHATTGPLPGRALFKHICYTCCPAPFRVAEIAPDIAEFLRWRCWVPALEIKQEYSFVFSIIFCGALSTETHVFAWRTPSPNPAIEIYNLGQKSTNSIR